MIAKYEIILKVADTGNITRAANELGYTQSGISHIINNFENELGFPLFNRKKTGVTLTNYGEDLIPYMREVLDANNILNKKIGKLSGLSTGSVKIGTFATVTANLLPQAIKDFKKICPNITVELVDGTYSCIEQWILSGEVDFGFLPLPIKHSLETIPCIEDEFVVISAKDRIITQNECVTFQELEQYNLELLIETGRDLQEMYSNKQFSTKFEGVRKDIYSTVTLVASDIGISIFPERIAEQYASQLNIYKIKDSKPRSICLASKDFKSLSPAAKKIVDIIKKAVD